MFTRWMNIAEHVRWEEQEPQQHWHKLCHKMKRSPTQRESKEWKGSEMNLITAPRRGFLVLSSSLCWFYFYGNPGPGQRLGWVNLEEHWEARRWGALSTNGSIRGKDEWGWSHFISQVQLNSKAYGGLKTLHQAKYILGIHINKQ